MPDLKVFSDDMQRGIDAFYQKCFTDFGWAYEPRGRHWDTANIRQAYMDGGCMWCLYENSELVGTVAIRTIDKTNNVAELKRLYLLKEYQGLGYGKLLFETALDYAIKGGYARICADTRNDRNASRHLMTTHGFREVSKYNDNQFAELFFELDLSNMNAQE